MIAEVFDIAIPTSGPDFDAIARIAATARAGLTRTAAKPLYSGRRPDNLATDRRRGTGRPGVRERRIADKGGDDH